MRSGSGFVVGGLIDVLAISGLNQALTQDQRRRDANVQARAIMDKDWMSPRERTDAARDILRRSDRLLDLGFRVDLRAIADDDLDDLEERRRGPDTP
jgi:hypothetical protein